MLNKKRLIASAAVAAALILGTGTAVVAAQQGGSSGQGDGSAITGSVRSFGENEADEGRGSDETLTNSSAQKAADAALGAVDGTVLEVERDDDPGLAYEVEIRTPDGNIAEVHLDGNLEVVDQAIDDRETEDQETEDQEIDD